MLPRDSPEARKMAGRSALWLRVWDISVATALRSYRFAGFVLSPRALYRMLLAPVGGSPGSILPQGGERVLPWRRESIGDAAKDAMNTAFCTKIIGENIERKAIKTIP